MFRVITHTAYIQLHRLSHLLKACCDVSSDQPPFAAAGCCLLLHQGLQLLPAVQLGGCELLGTPA
jgi:hypothetical protein